MRNFKAISNANGSASGIVTIRAKSFGEAKEKAFAAGATLLALPPQKQVRVTSLFERNDRLFIDESVLCTQLKSLLSAGLSLQESIKALRIHPSSKAHSILLDAIDAQLKKGSSFSSSLVESQHLVRGISPLLISMLRSAEKTSELTQALSRYISYATQIGLLKQKIRAALIYPCFLLFVGALVVMFLLFFVVPRFAGIYDSVRVDLPFAAQLLLIWGKWVKAHGSIFLITIIGAIGILFVLAKKSVLARAGTQLLARIPRLYVVIESVKLARLYRTLSMLLAGGMPLKEALQQLSRDTELNMGNRIALVQSLVEQGISLTESFKAQGLFVGVAQSLVSAGEASGNLGPMLSEAALFLEADSFRTVDKFMKLLEPTLMALLGIIIGGIVILMYMPIFELAGSLQ
jgi:general secretion pathway protein F